MQETTKLDTRVPSRPTSPAGRTAAREKHSKFLIAADASRAIATFKRIGGSLIVISVKEYHHPCRTGPYYVGEICILISLWGGPTITRARCNVPNYTESSPCADRGSSKYGQDHLGPSILHSGCNFPTATTVPRTACNLLNYTLFVRALVPCLHYLHENYRFWVRIQQLLGLCAFPRLHGMV
jgi:hypothetical protein